MTGHPSLEWLFRASWQASALAVVVLIVQWALGRRLSAAWRCNLWLLVACRFLLPVSFGSPASMFNLARGRMALDPLAAPETHAPGAVAKQGLAGNASAPAQPQMPVHSPAVKDIEAVSTTGSTPVSVTPSRSVRFSPGVLWEMAGVLWLLGAGVFAVRVTADSLRLARRLRGAAPVRDSRLLEIMEQCAREIGIGRRPALVETNAVSSPALYGIWRPRLLLPVGMEGKLDSVQLRFVFLHELAHLKRQDVAVGWLTAVLQIMHWFNPIAWLATRAMRAERELACDDMVLIRAGGDQRQNYGETLLRLLQEIGRPSCAPGLVGILRDRTGLRRRMGMIAAFQPGAGGSLWPVLLFCGVAVVGLTDSFAAKVKATPPAAPPAARPSAAGSWEKLATADLLRGRGGNSAVWTGSQMLIFGGEGMGTSFDDGAAFDPAQNVWTPLPSQGAPASRTQFTAVWTGGEMIVWGGFGGIWGNDTNHEDGACYNPISKTWRPTSLNGAPQARFNQSAVWTGTEMLIWGGYTDSHATYHGAYNHAELNSGGAYNPASDTWRDISRAGAPSARFNSAAVWTGNRMIIWGGADSTKALGDGAMYNPATDQWTLMSNLRAPSARNHPMAAWTGTEMIVWGGGSRDNATHYTDGARYNPATDQWTPMSTTGMPGGYFDNSAWTGSKLFLWGGRTSTSKGTAAVNLPVREQAAQGSNIRASTPILAMTTADNQAVIAAENAQMAAAAAQPMPSGGSSRVIVDSQGQIINRGLSVAAAPSESYLDSGAIYDPATDSWTAIGGGNGGPSARVVTTLVSTGNGVLLFGGWDGASHLNDTYYYSY